MPLPRHAPLTSPMTPFSVTRFENRRRTHMTRGGREGCVHMTLVWCSPYRVQRVSQGTLNTILDAHASRVSTLKYCCADEDTCAHLRQWCSLHALTTRHIGRRSAGRRKRPRVTMHPGETVVAYILTSQAGTVILFTASEHEALAITDAIATARDSGVLRSLRSVIVIRQG